MKIAYLINFAGKAGTEKYVEDLMRIFSGQGDQCTLIYNIPGELSQKCSGVYPTVKLDMSPHRILPAAISLAKYCREENVDVVHAQYPRENVIAVLSRLFRPGTKVVFTAHLTIRQGMIWRLLNRVLTPGDNAVLSVCRQGADILRKNGVYPKRIHVVYNGVEPQEPLPRLNKIREEFRLSPDTFIFIVLARYAPEKGLHYLLDCMSELRNRTKKPFACVICGDGEMYEDIKQEIQIRSLNGYVFQAGFRRNISELLASSDCCLSTSLYGEAMSFALLEAMRQGLPLAVTDVGAGRELAEGCGFVSEPGNVETMVQGLEKLISDPELCARMGAEASGRVKEQFNLFHQAEIIHSVYSGCVNSD